MRELRDRYRDDHRVQALAAAQAADRELVLGAVHGGLMPLLLAAWSQQTGRPRLVVCGDPAGTAEDLEELGVAVAVLPELDLISQGELGAETDGADHAGHARRMAALEAFSAGHLLLATPAAAEQPVPSLADVAATGIVLRKGQEHDLHQLVDRLVDAGYRVVAAVEGRGELAVRGGIVDVFPWIGADPCRIEFFGDQVEAIRRFDVFTQESIAQADEAVLASAKRGHATRSLWEQLPPGPLCVLGDLPLRGRLKKDHGRREIRLARQLEGGAEDGASLGVERLRGDLRRGLSGLKALLAETGAGGAVLLARSDEAAKELGKHAADAGIPARVTVGRLHAGFRDVDGGLVAVHDFELAEREPVRKRSGRVAGGSPLSSLNDLRHGDHVVHLRHGVGVFRGMATLEKRGFLEDFLLLEFAEGTRLYVPVDAIDLVQKWVGAGGRAPALDRIGGGAWAKRKAKAEKAIEDMSAELLAAQARRLAAGGIPSTPDTPELRRFEAEFPFEETEDQLSAVREIKADMERAVAMDRLLCGDVGFGKTEVAMRAAFKAVQSGLQVAVMAPTTLLAEQHLESFSERLGPFGARVAGMTRFRSAKEKAAVLVKAAEGAVDVLVGTHALLSDKLRFARLGLLVIDEEHRFGVKHKEKLKELRHAGQIPCDVLTLSATPIPRTLHFSMLGIRDISVLAEAPAARLAVETRVAPWDDQMVQHAIERELAREGQLFAVHNRIAELDNLVRRLVHLSPRLRIDIIHGQMEEERIVAVMEAFRHRRLDCLVATSIVESGIDIPNANTLFVADAQVFGLAELHQLRGRIGRFSNQAYAYFLTPPHRDIGEEARERLSAIQEYAELGAGFKLAMRDLELRGAGNLLGGEQSGHIDAIGYELYTRLLGEAVERAKGQAIAAAGGPAPKAKPPAAPALGAAHSAAEAFINLRLDAYIPDTYLETPTLKFELHKDLDRARRIDDLARLARAARDRYGPLPVEVERLFRVRALRLRARELNLERIDVADRQIRLHLNGPLPQALLAVKLPEVVHIQPDGAVLVLFIRGNPGPDDFLGILCRMCGLDLGWLGKGY